MSSEHKIKPGCFFCNPIFADSLFSDLPPETLDSFAHILHRKHFPANQPIITAGELPRCIYILIEGKARIFLNSETANPETAKLAERNEIIGLSETLACLPYTISVTTITDCLFEIVARKDLIRFLGTQPGAAFRLARQLGMNLQKHCFPASRPDK
jgi:CRP-like cAMP-binding protein